MARLAIRMPKMSMTMTEGEVSTWLVGVGDDVAEGDAVCEVMTDKVDMEVESTVSGTLVEIAVDSGMAAVGDPIGWVEGEDTGGGFGDLLGAPEPDPEPDPESEPAETATTSQGVPAAEVPAQVLPAEEAATDAPPADADEPSTPGPVAAVPRARGLAAERGIDLTRVVGTGPDGLIRVVDVEDVEAAGTGRGGEDDDTVHTPTPSAQPAPRPSTDRRASVRRVVARTMAPSALVPQFTVWRELGLDAADAQRRGTSWTTVLLRAYAAALREVPDLLCRWEDDGLGERRPPAVALAVATERGLLVPTFVEPDRRDAGELDEEIRDVVRAARAGRLDQAYLGVANASLSNLGGLGVDRFQALLTPPQASVLSLGSIAPRPVAVPGGVGLALTVHAGLTVDHRVADGDAAAELLARLADRLRPLT